MEQEHRDKIKQNIEKLIQYTDYDELMQECINRKLLFDVMKEIIEAATPDRRSRHRMLLEKITHRGPKAFELFSSILKDKFPNAYDFFDHLGHVYGEISLHRRRNRRPQCVNNNNGNMANGSMDTRRECSPPIVNNANHVTVESNECTQSPATTSNTNGLTADGASTNGSASNGLTANGSSSHGKRTEGLLEEFEQPVKARTNYTVQKSTKFYGEDGGKVSSYRMRSLVRGVLFLVNIVQFERPDKKRNGADADRDNLIALFRGMGFKIFYYENLKRGEFINLVDQLVVSSHLRTADCLVFGLLSHGEREFTSFNVEFSDSHKLDVEDILSKFSNSNCDRLIGKPKIFIFPFCRGGRDDPGIMGRRRTETDHIGAPPMHKEVPLNMSTYSDMKICYATVPGYRSFRDPENGSWYIQIMCEIWSEHAHDTHLDDLLKMVGDRASAMRTEESKLQTCSNEDRGFFKRLYFNPGYYGNKK